MTMLTPEQVERFVEDGFLRLEGAFSRSVADECRASLWAETGVDPADTSTWTRPVIRLPVSDAAVFVQAANTPRMIGAFDQLVGPGRWHARPNVGTFPNPLPQLTQAMPDGTSTAATKSTPGLTS